MSRAFVKEAEDDRGEELPDRPVSQHLNLVTPSGLDQIEAELEHWRTALTAARDQEDRSAQAKAGRELRYWSARRATAQVVDPQDASDVVRFGSTVTIERQDGRRQTWRIVGEDEADPAKGSVPYVAPLAQALMGKEAGEEVTIGDGDVEIVEVS